MTKPDRSRKDPRADATRASLIATAEILFAEAGVDGVSLRQIGAAIGSSNSNVVAYYFGAKEGLITAVFQHRLTTIEAHRSRLLDAAETVGRSQDMNTLLNALFRPILELTNEHGRHSYAAFLATIFRANKMDIRIALGAQYPATQKLVRLIRRASGLKDTKTLRNRLQICLAMVTAATHLADHDPNCAVEKTFDDTIEMMCAAMSAPAPPKKK